MLTLTSIRRAAAAAPTDAAAIANLGNALIARFEERAGIQYLREAIRLDDRAPEHHWRLGRVLSDSGQLGEAATSLERALSLDPDYERALDTLGWLYTSRLNRQEDARRVFRRGLALSPQHLDHHVGFSRTFVSDGGPAAITRAVQRELGETHDRALLQMGVALALSQYGRYEESRACLADLERLAPDHVEVMVQRARVDHALGDVDAARAGHEEAFRKFPRHIGAVMRYLQFLFRTGEYRRAQEIYRAPATQSALHVPESPTRWKGTPLDGLIMRYRMPGGYGDMVQWSRFAPLMRERGADVLIECAVPVRDLLDTMPGLRGVCAPFDEGVEYDVECEPHPALLLLDWDWASLARQIPYLHPPRARVEAWRERFAREPGFHVGIVWRAGFEVPTRDDHYIARSLPAELLRPLLDLPGVIFHNLYVGRLGQLELEALDPKLPLRPLSDDFAPGFMDTAAATMALDLTVTVDTSVAHVAGAVGAPSLIMLPYFADWRWQDFGHECSWYPNSRLIRQPRPGDWVSVIAAVREELRTRAAASQGLTTSSPPLYIPHR